jgi:hypothetical protein
MPCLAGNILQASRQVEHSRDASLPRCSYDGRKIGYASRQIDGHSWARLESSQPFWLARHLITAHPLPLFTPGDEC